MHLDCGVFFFFPLPFFFWVGLEFGDVARYTRGASLGFIRMVSQGVWRVAFDGVQAVVFYFD